MKHVICDKHLALYADELRKAGMTPDMVRLNLKSLEVAGDKEAEGHDDGCLLCLMVASGGNLSLWMKEAVQDSLDMARQEGLVARMQ